MTTSLLRRSVSGDFVSISGAPVSISGNVVNISTSGQGVWVSGSVATSVSGNVVSITRASGFNGVYLSNQSGSVGAQVTSWSNQDGAANNTQGLFTAAANWALDESGTSMNRLRTTASGSAGAAGGTRFKLLTTVSGDPVTISGNVTNIGKLPSYMIRVTNTTITSGIHFLVVMPVSGSSIIRLKAWRVWPSAEVNTISGEVVKWDICRITSTSGGGTALSAVSSDPSSPESGVFLTIQKRATSGCVVQSTLFTHVDTNFGPLGTGVAGQGTTVAPSINILYSQLAQSFNILNPAGVSDMAEIVLRSGFGVSFRQSIDAGYTQVNSGAFDMILKYNVE